MRLGAGGATFAELSVHSVRGARAVGHGRLTLLVQAAIREQVQNSVRLFAFAGDVYLRTSKGDQVPLARLEPAGSPLTLQSRPYSDQLGLVFEAELDRTRLTAIEKLRNSGPVELMVTLRAHADLGGQLHNVGDSQTITLNPGQWGDILRELGYRDGLRLEVELTKRADQGAAKAVGFVESAQEHFLHGQYRDAVAKCRDAIEALGLTLPVDAQEAAGAARTDGKEQRVARLAAALKLLPHAAKHVDETTQAFTWSREDAAMQIAMTAALIRHRLPE